MVDYWRQISTGPDPPNIINVVVEMTKGSQNKYEYDKEVGGFRLDRVLYTFFPCDYGFVPQTLDDDGDPLDAILLINQPTFTGCIVIARPIGIMRMLDEGREDDKILAVSITDPYYKQIVDITDVPDALVKELTHFFNHYKKVEGKETKVLEWRGVVEAKRLIEKNMNSYKKKGEDQKTARRSF